MYLYTYVLQEFVSFLSNYCIVVHMVKLFIFFTKSYENWRLKNLVISSQPHKTSFLIFNDIIILLCTYSLVN